VGGKGEVAVGVLVGVLTVVLVLVFVLVLLMEVGEYEGCGWGGAGAALERATDRVKIRVYVGDVVVVLVLGLQ